MTSRRNRQAHLREDGTPEETRDVDTPGSDRGPEGDGGPPPAFEDVGREATTPSDIPTAGWKGILKRTFASIKDDHVQMMAAGLAFYTMLAIFPALIALVSVYGLVSDPADVQDQIESVTSGMPESTSSLIESQLTGIVESSSSALGWATAIALLGALWTASSGMAQGIKAINRAYDEEETRGFFKLRGLALGLTLAFILIAIVSMGLIVVVPPLLAQLELGGVIDALLSVAQYLVLALVFMTGLAILYRFAPDRTQASWRWLSWGAVIATVLWIIASIGFSIFVTQFGNYQETYGALAGVIILLLWFFISGFVVLMGAELNSEMEHQTRRDTTKGPERPMGERGAVKADTLGDPNP